MFSGINEEKKKSMPYASCHFFYLSLKFVFVFFHLFIFTIKEIYQKNRAKEGERERERDGITGMWYIKTKEISAWSMQSTE